jgi:hypothetical protein
MTHAVSPPLFILAPARCFTSLVCTALGQHPEMYGVPELNLCAVDTMQEWWFSFRQGRGMFAHGLVRTVAELVFGAQSEESAARARRWIWERRHLTATAMLRIIAGLVHPRVLVEKSPTNVSTPIGLRRTREAFPRARYVHLVRHPLGQAQSFLKVSEEFGIPSGALERWLETDGPQRWWYNCNRNIIAFLAALPAEQKLRVRGEDILENPAAGLTGIAGWLGLRTDAAAIEAMRHPERSPFAHIGPAGAPWGNDPNFLGRPELRPTRPKALRLDQPLHWGAARGELPAELKTLAREFGYS